MKWSEIDDLYRQPGNTRAIRQFYTHIQVNEHDGNSCGRTPLHVACSHADVEHIEYLLAHGADVNIRDNEGYTPLGYLAKLPEAATLEKRQLYCCTVLLLNAGASLPRSGRGTTALHEAVRNRNYGTAEALLDSGIPLDVTDSDGYNALHIACATAGEIAARIVRCQEYVADFNRRWHPGKDKERIRQELAMLRREEWRYYHLTNRLFESGRIEAEEKSNSGKTPLTIAIERGAKLIAARLSGSDPETDLLAMRIGGMEIFQAMAREDDDAVEALLQRGTDLQIVYDGKEYYPYAGQSPLGCALSDHRLELAAVLLKAGAAPDYRDAEEKTAVVRWMERDDRRHCQETDPYIPMFRLLTQKGWHPEAPANRDEETAFSVACHSDTQPAEALFGYLLAEGTDINSRDRLGRTPLMHLCKTLNPDYPKKLEPLLEAGADIRNADKAGNTALHYLAEQYGNRAKEAAEMLFDFGRPETDAVNNDGKTALDLATEKGNEALVKFLLKNM